MLVRQNKEYGGCLPLEKICFNQNPFYNYPHITFNSGCSAILGAVRNYGTDSVWLPHYLCPSVKEFLKDHGVIVREYFLTKEYMPEVSKVEKNEMILWVNWYGCMKEESINSIRKKYGKQLIFDNTQALFYDPDIANYSCYYVYSCRKFLGVPEGAYLVQKGIREIEGQRGFFEADWRYLCEALNQGSNSQYSHYKENEKKIEEHFCDMSYLTKEYLKAVPWEQIKEKRKNNFDFLHQKLRHKNGLKVDFTSQSAFMYPFMTEKEGLRKHLIENKIYVPMWWKHLLQLKDISKAEYHWAKYIIPVPIDQRYNETDMQKIAEVILRFLERKDVEN